MTSPLPHGRARAAPRTPRGSTGPPPGSVERDINDGATGRRPDDNGGRSVERDRERERTAEGATGEDAGDLQQRLDELQDRVRRLTDASRRKDELLGLLGHQLRNPLSPIRNSLHLLKRGLNDPRLTAELYEVMDRQ